jgi:hypothetical protein
MAARQNREASQVSEETEAMEIKASENDDFSSDESMGGLEDSYSSGEFEDHETQYHRYIYFGGPEPRGYQFGSL